MNTSDQPESKRRQVTTYSEIPSGAGFRTALGIWLMAVLIAFPYASPALVMAFFLYPLGLVWHFPYSDLDTFRNVASILLVLFYLYLTIEIVKTRLKIELHWFSFILAAFLLVNSVSCQMLTSQLA